MPDDPNGQTVADEGKTSSAGPEQGSTSGQQPTETPDALLKALRSERKARKDLERQVGELRDGQAGLTKKLLAALGHGDGAVKDPDALAKELADFKTKSESDKAALADQLRGEKLRRLFDRHAKDAHDSDLAFAAAGVKSDFDPDAENADSLIKEVVESLRKTKAFLFGSSGGGQSSQAATEPAPGSQGPGKTGSNKKIWTPAELMAAMATPEYAAKDSPLKREIREAVDEGRIKRT